MELHIACLIQACQDIGLEYQFLDREHNFVRIWINNDPLYFQLNKTPFNSAVMASICIDKEHTYRLFQDAIRMPKTIGFLDYNTVSRYQKYLTFTSLGAITTEIEKELAYPVIVKKNKGGLGVNVFMCQNRAEAHQALNVIFDRNSSDYDYVALVQEYLPFAKEFRLVCFRGEAMLAYERISGSAAFNARYWESEHSSTRHITDQNIIDDLVEFVCPAMGIKGLEFIGFDIVLAKDGNYYLLELNSGPRFDHFIQCNGTEAVVEMYRRILNNVGDEVR